MPRGIVIPAEVSEPIYEKSFTRLSEYQSLLGGTFQAVGTTSPDAGFFVNEEGKLIGLPLNPRATLLWWMHEERARNRDVFMGNVVLIGPADHDGRTLDTPAVLVDLLLHTPMYKVEVETIEAPGVWNGNQARYDTWVDAYHSALSLFERWALASNVRVVAA